MPTKVLLVNTAAETVLEARELTPPGFELIVAAPEVRRPQCTDDCRLMRGHIGRTQTHEEVLDLP